MARLPTIAVILLLLASSCATIVRPRSYRVQVSSPAPGAHLAYADSVYALPATLRVRPTRQPLQLTLLTDTSRKAFAVKPAPTLAFLLGNAGFFYAAPLAYAVDFTNPKRLHYGRRIVLDPAATDTVLRTRGAQWLYGLFHRPSLVKQGSMAFQLSFPVVNGLVQRHPGIGRQSAGGLFGLQAGGAWACAPNRFVLATVGAHFTGGAMDVVGQSELLTAFAASVSHNHRFGRFTLGYGVQATRNVWHRGEPSRPDSGQVYLPAATLRNTALGALVSAHFDAGRNFRLGLSYRPSVWDITARRATYQHSIAFDVGWLWWGNRR